MIRNKNNIIMWMLPYLLIILTLLLVKYSKKRIDEEYSIGVVKKETIGLFVNAKGLVSYNKDSTINITIPVQLKVDKSSFNSGDRVKKGDLIVNFSDYVLNTSNDKSNQLQEELSSLNKELRTQEKLYKYGAESSFERIQELNSQIALIEKELIDVNNEMKLLKSRITSPVDGYVIDINAEENGYNDTNLPTVSFIDQRDLRIKTNTIKKSEAQNIKRGDKAIVTNDKNKELSLEAFVYDIYGDDEKGNNYLELIMKDTKNLALNDELNIKIYYKELKERLVIPIEAVVYNEKDNKKDIKNEKKKNDEQIKLEEKVNTENREGYVYVIDKENFVRKVKVLLGVNNTELVEIVDGLDEGDEIIISPDEKLQDKVIVRRKNLVKEMEEYDKNIKDLEDKKNKNKVDNEKIDEEINYYKKRKENIKK